jgi:hypothetical protein
LPYTFKATKTTGETKIAVGGKWLFVVE